jgi:hypothetical protein
MRKMLFPREYAENLKRYADEFRQENTQLHKQVLLGITDIAALGKEIEHADGDVARLIQETYYYGFLTTSDKEEVLRNLQTLKQALDTMLAHAADPSRVHALSSVLVHIAGLIEHESHYLAYTPGGGHKEYVRLQEILAAPEHAVVMNKVRLEFKNSGLLVAGRPVQGLAIQSGVFGCSIQITGEHYSSEEDIKRMSGARLLTAARWNAFSASNDPYCYLAEPGFLSYKNEDEIRMTLGAQSAEACIIVKVSVPLHKVWVRAQPGYPVKYAIEAREIPFTAPRPQRGFKVVVRGREEYWK